MSLLFALACLGQSDKLPSDGSAVSDGISWLDALEVDLGTIPQDSAITLVFRFQNDTEAPLIIDNVRTSCGCTAGDWEVAPTLPGEIGTVSLSFDAAKRGYFRKRATVWFHGVRRPTRLMIAGEVSSAN
ncbi:MAG: DUF1573 domain-containing protein [Bacteroidota bacterium]